MDLKRSSSLYAFSPSGTILSAIPNSLTLFRIISALVFPFLEIGIVRFMLLISMAISDFLDGYIARRFNVTTKLGTLLDPFADKLTALCCCSTFLYEGSLSPIQILALFTREAALLIFMCILLYRGTWKRWSISSFWIGKIVTAGQFILFLILSLGVGIPHWIIISMAILGALSLLELLHKASRMN